MCDKCFYAFLCCFLPCIEKREARHERKYDQEEAPRPVESKSKARERGAAAVKTSSPRRRVSAQHCQQVHQDLVANLSQPMNGKQTAAQFRLRMAFSVTKEHLSPDFFTPVIRDLTQCSSAAVSVIEPSSTGKTCRTHHAVHFLA
jgi:hypothetical protein